MRFFKVVAGVALCVFALSVLANAKQNQFGVADEREVIFSTPIRVGGTLLPQGNYRVLHTMQGSDHIMVFEQTGVKNPSTAKVKCQLTPLTVKAQEGRQTYTINAQHERVLQSLVFRGDRAQHNF